MGVIPPTRLLLTRNGVIQGHFDTYAEIALAVPINIDDTGQITLDGEKVYPNYTLIPKSGGFEKHEAIKDWIKNYMGNRKGYSIYRYLSY